MPNAYQHLSGVPYTAACKTAFALRIQPKSGICIRIVTARDSALRGLYSSDVRFGGTLGRSKPQSLAYGPV